MPAGASRPLAAHETAVLRGLKFDAQGPCPTFRADRRDLTFQGGQAAQPLHRDAPLTVRDDDAASRTALVPCVATDARQTRGLRDLASRSPATACTSAIMAAHKSW